MTATNAGERKPTVTEHVKDLLATTPEPMTYDRIVTDPRFGKVTKEYVSSVLSNLVKKGELRRVRWGVYGMPPTKVQETDPVPEAGPPQAAVQNDVFAQIVDRLDEALMDLSAGLLVRELKLTPAMAWKVMKEIGEAREGLRGSLNTPDGFRAICYLLAGSALCNQSITHRASPTS